MKRQPACICINLRRAARAVSQLYDQALDASGIKITQFSLLRAIERNQPVAISALADEVELDRTTLARNLRPLERDDLIVLAVGDDQRVTEVSLTRSGRAVIARALPLWRAAQERFASGLPQGRVAQLQSIAAEVSAAASATGRPASKRRR